MKTFRSFFFSLSLAGLAQAQTAPANPAHAHDEPLALEAMVVSAGPDAKSAFDLAQGTSVLVSDQLRRSVLATLGDTLATTPGVNATYYGPGASRPIIRGLGGDRVRMLDNGVGSLDASNVSPDHNVSVEPLLVDRIEVLRGPATLLYGNSAVGGVVNVIDNRIPAAAPAQPVSGRAEFRYGSAAHERTGVLAVTAGGPAFALQVNGLRTETDDVRIPGFADRANPANEGTLPNSAISTRSVSVGGTRFGASGNFGVAVSEYATVYGVPVGEPIAIDLRQRRADLRAELTRPFGVFKSAKLRFGLADYTHAEVDASTGLPNTTFSNHAHEARLELTQREIGGLTGTVGLQTSRSDFSAAGAEVVTPPTLTRNHALFVLESFQARSDLTLQIGGRYEFQSIELGVVDPLLPAYPSYAARTGEQRNAGGLSVSAGAVYYPAKDYSLGFSLAYTQRLPVAQEVFSNGPHGGTGAYEIGTAGLGNETSLGLDLTLRKRAGFVTGAVGVFLNRIQNFIFEQRDAAHYFDDATGTFLPYPEPPGVAFLPIYQFIAKDAHFYGGEAELTLHLVDTVKQRLHLELTGDYVRARQTTDDESLPRIPPMRVGATLRYSGGPWNAGLSLRHSFRQDRVAPGETETAGYTLLGADLTYRFTRTRAQWELFARGSNLTDEDARLSTSFLKDIAPLAGRSLTLGVRLTY
ncbi:MAG TPA: TonB-dependent receptor [Lacunisphaera sp.]|jgi:iron complex outermembrane receptor protein|nr:TonB-dependent receptor [Lacunisphaera sp.]